MDGGSLGRWEEAEEDGAEYGDDTCRYPTEARQYRLEATYPSNTMLLRAMHGGVSKFQ